MAKVLKPVPADKQKSLGKLPQPVRNKMGFQKDGGKSVKKAQVGSKVALRTAQLKRVGRLAAKNPDKAEQVGARMVERATRRQRGKEYIQKNLSSLMPKSKGGSKLKKQAAVAIAMKKAGKSPKKAMCGMKMGKCKYGCN